MASVGIRRSSSVRTKDNIAIFEDEHAGSDSPDEGHSFSDDLVKGESPQHASRTSEQKLGAPIEIEEFDNSEKDPFSETDEEEESEDEHGYEEHGLVEEHDGYIGEAPMYKVSHSYDRSFSTTTAIHLEDPDHEYEKARKSDSWGRNLGDYTNTLGGIEEDGPFRNVSETVSAMPDDYEFSDRKSGGRFVDDHRERPPLSQSGRYNRQSDQFSPSADGKRMSRSPTKERPISGTQSGRQVVSGFRNTSSVKNMQLSSPSPTPFSSPPRSSSKRYGTTVSPSRHYTPSRRSSVMEASPRYHPEPQKEYPLVLLHCSISGASIPYSQTALESTLSSKVVASVGLLREKLSATVIERGILVPHPGEDYELLEERILESLELKQPRLGKCGHFNGNAGGGDGRGDREVSGQTTKPSAVGHEEGPDHFDGATACPDCGGHTCSDVSAPGCEFYRQWDMKVYAANGLMRAGAWTAAWREMEKVDIEVGVFIPERFRRELDAFALKEAKEAYEKAAERTNMGNVPSIPVQEATAMPGPIPMTKQRSSSTSATESASTAACARAPSIQSSKSKLRTHPAKDSNEEIPLTVLLDRYVRRTLAHRTDVVIGVLILIIGIWFTGRSTTTNANATVSKQDIPNAIPSVNVLAPLSAIQGTSTVVVSSPSVVTSYVVSTPLASELPACTFAPSEAADRGMTALPSDLALSVLEDAYKQAPVPSAVAPKQAMEVDAAEEETKSSTSAEVQKPETILSETAYTESATSEPIQSVVSTLDDDLAVEEVLELAEEVVNDEKPEQVDENEDKPLE